MKMSTFDDEIYRFRWPICYIPPPWEIFIWERDPRITEKYGEEIFGQDLVKSSPRAMLKYYKIRIQMVDDLVNSGALSSDIGKSVISHYETHINELRARG